MCHFSVEGFCSFGLVLLGDFVGAAMAVVVCVEFRVWRLRVSGLGDFGLPPGLDLCVHKFPNRSSHEVG